jgi:hypothetical protein
LKKGNKRTEWEKERGRKGSRRKLEIKKSVFSSAEEK